MRRRGVAGVALSPVRVLGLSSLWPPDAPTAGLAVASDPTGRGKVASNDPAPSVPRLNVFAEDSAFQKFALINRGSTYA